jgi:hypothetical protein
VTLPYVTFLDGVGIFGALLVLMLIISEMECLAWLASSNPEAGGDGPTVLLWIILLSMLLLFGETILRLYFSSSFYGGRPELARRAEEELNQERTRVGGTADSE